MTLSIEHGPNDTAVGGLATVSLTVPPHNYDTDFRQTVSGPGLVVYTDVTSPTDQPSMLRIAQSERPNIYAGTSIDPSVFLPTKKGTDTIIEVREIWKEVDSTDLAFVRMFPVRAALTLTVPNYGSISDEDVEALVGRVVAALFDQGAATTDTGITALLHGVVDKRS